MTNRKTCQYATIYLCLIPLLALTPLGSTLQAQDPAAGEPGEGVPVAPEPKDPRIVEIEVLKAIAEAQAAIAESRAKVINAALPGKVEPLDGTLETEGDPIEAVILTYEALKESAVIFRDELKKLASRPRYSTLNEACCHDSPKNLFLHSAQEVDAILRYQSLWQRLTFLKKRLKRIADEFDRFDETAASTDEEQLKGFVSGLVPILSGVLESSLDIIALFRTDIKIKNTLVQISVSAEG